MISDWLSELDWLYLIMAENSLVSLLRSWQRFVQTEVMTGYKFVKVAWYDSWSVKLAPVNGVLYFQPFKYLQCNHTDPIRWVQVQVNHENLHRILFLCLLLWSVGEWDCFFANNNMYIVGWINNFNVGRIAILFNNGIFYKAWKSYSRHVAYIFNTLNKCNK